MKPNKRRGSEDVNAEYPPMFENFGSNPDSNQKPRRSCVKEEPHTFSNNVAAGSEQVYFRWTPDSIEMMLHLRFDMEEQFNQRLRQKKELWNEIATEMWRRGGYVLTGEVCDLKFRNMLQTYKKNRLKEERGQQELIVWEYYTAFKESCTSFNDSVINNLAEEATNSEQQLLPSLLCESVCSETQPGGAYEANSQVAAAELSNNNTESQQELLQPVKAASSRRSSTQANKRQRLTSAAQPDIKRSPQEQVAAVDTSSSAMFLDASQQRLDAAPSGSSSTEQTEQQQRTMPVLIKSAASTAETVTSINATTTQPTTAALSTTAPPAAFPTIDIRADTPAVFPTAPALQGVEVRECELFGELVGLQMMSVRDIGTRALLKLKIQELIYQATMGRLVVPHNASGLH